MYRAFGTRLTVSNKKAVREAALRYHLKTAIGGTGLAYGYVKCARRVEWKPNRVEHLDMAVDTHRDSVAPAILAGRSVRWYLWRHALHYGNACLWTMCPLGASAPICADFF